METYLELSKAAQDQILEAAKQNQQIAIQAAQAWAQAVAPYASQAPAAPAIEGIPTAEQLVENSFGFAKKLLETQQELALGIVEAWAPLSSPAPKEKAKASASA